MWVLWFLVYHTARGIAGAPERGAELGPLVDKKHRAPLDNEANVTPEPTAVDRSIRVLMRKITLNILPRAAVGQEDALGMIDWYPDRSCQSQS